MATPYWPPQEVYEEAMRIAQDKGELRAKARQVQDRAEQLASSEGGVNLESEVTEGVRPRGRTYARVSSPNVQQEWGGTETERRRILGRAAESS